MDTVEELTTPLRPNEQLASNDEPSANAVVDEAEIGALVSEFNVPPGCDDRRGPWLHQYQRPPARSGQQATRDSSVVRLRTDAQKGEDVLRITKTVAGSATLGELFEGQLSVAIAAEEAQPGAEIVQADLDAGQTIASTAASGVEPRLRLRVQALVCRNSDGRTMNGDAGQSRAELESAISGVLNRANAILGTANIELVFFPSADIVIRNDSAFNQDFWIPASELWQLTKEPPLTAAEAQALENRHSTAEYRNSVARQYTGRIVLLFADGSVLVKNGNHWEIAPGGGGGFSGETLEFVKLRSWASDDDEYATFVAHEVGHYLHLAHTMSESFFASAEEKATMTDSQLRDLLIGRITSALETERAKGTPAALLTQNVMDPDRPAIADTVPDPGHEVFHYLNRVASGNDECNGNASHIIRISTGEPVVLAPDRSLVMSYFKHCTIIGQRFSAQQAQRARHALINGNRNHIVAVQLGETSYPNEVVVGVWNPSTAGQFYTWDKSHDEFRALNAQQNSAGSYLVAQQAYTKNGATRYDGIWNPGSQRPDIIWGWLVDDFRGRDENNAANGLRLRHLESYLLPDGQARVNAIWYPATQATTWVQGWAKDDLNSKLTPMKDAGWRVIHLNAWNLPDNGPVRYDVVWEAGHSYEQFVRLEMSGAEVASEYNSHWSAGRKLQVLDTFVNFDFNVQRYAGVWNPNPSAQYVMWGHTREQIRAAYDEMWNQNMKLGGMAMVRL